MERRSEVRVALGDTGHHPKEDRVAVDYVVDSIVEGLEYIQDAEDAIHNYRQATTEAHLVYSRRCLLNEFLETFCLLS
eukprot:CAMPEP_0197663344 /NCGR_PEP_ID=MMETSP1338-20131121/57081_1 /TAXON_ID=43686 ORGANISM="Pelagodinium beii, Strain RCC1491" /NCGR_SAMPLE_ID=MMETSP1338 /ASSEMBLY_ACC=CAM_ASM_000754 /LENGTH=77 /DNA_ID=CAMNT_0043241661 /DNA_START=246 /DNA_END=476 /DNA_ORIENTATION=-